MRSEAEQQSLAFEEPNQAAEREPLLTPARAAALDALEKELAEFLKASHPVAA
ncbi:MAG: hypothetical protein JOZ70_09185 [Pseudolabrys sp.]|nr:hypothetical protein [Pseudolabrys sp.]